MDEIKTLRWYNKLPYEDKKNAARWFAEESPETVAKRYQENTNCDDDEKEYMQKVFRGLRAKLYIGYSTGHYAKLALVTIAVIKLAKIVKNRVL